MVNGIVIVALLLSSVAVSLQDADQSADDDYDNDYYDDSEPIDDLEEIQHTKNPKILKLKRDREELTTEKQVAKYEVTELIIDVPNESTRRIPVVTNFTLTRPLNLAGVSNNKTKNVGASAKDEGDEIIHSILVSNEPTTDIQGKNAKGINFEFDDNDYFEPKDGLEEEFDKEFSSDEVDFKVEENTKPSKGFKEHFHNFRKNIVNEFKSVVDKHKDGIHNSIRKIVSGPIYFFNKLHRKSSDLVSKLHKAVSKHKFHDCDDETIDHSVEHYDTDD